jgi:beta-lactamase class A
VAIAAVLAFAALAAAPAHGRADDGALLRAADRAAAVHAAHRAALGADGERLQRAYDAARDLQEAVRAAGPPSASCARLAAALQRLAGAVVLHAEGVDRPLAAQARRGAAAEPGAAAAVPAARAACRPAATPGRTRLAALVEPRPGEAFFGTVEARAPAGATAAAIRVDGRELGGLPLAGGRARGLLVLDPGRHTVEVRFATPRGTVVQRSAGAWLLPSSGAVEPAEPAPDAAASARLRRAATGFGGLAALWRADVGSGLVAGANAEARFPAASTVKLGVLLATLARHAAPETSADAHDLEAIGRWSSNLAANRLVRRTGGPGAAVAALRRAGARSSTYPGDYRPGTAVGEPPPVSRRVTTAADLGAVLRTLHGGAVGQAESLRRLGLTRHQARVGLRLLLDAEPVRDARGLLVDAVPAGTPVAHKPGWLTTARHDAGLVYGPSGPVVVVVLAWRAAGLSRQAALPLGAAAVRG